MAAQSRPPHTRGRLLAALALLTVTAAVAAGAVASPGTPSAPSRHDQVTTLPRAPQLVGLTANSAVRSLEALGLHYAFHTTSSSRVFSGSIVVGQSPSPGVFVGIDQVVHVFVQPRPAASVAVVIYLDRKTVLPGPIDRGIAVVTNNSGRVLHIRDCRNRGGLVAGLVSTQVAYFTGPPLLDCRLVEPIRPGVTTLRTWVATQYQNCGTTGMPKCTALGLSDLPAGTYWVRFPLAGLPATTTVQTTKVTVLPPSWLTSLSGSQGSLLVAASTCVATAMVPNPLPKVSVVVIHQGQVVARRSVTYPGGTFTLALTPGRYVVRSGAQVRATITIVSRKQTIADVRARCI